MPLGRVKFEDFELDYDRYELLRAGQSLKLEKIPMELLLLIVERRGNLVTRQEIAQHLWGNGVHLDTEHGINTAVRKIRHVLKDDPDKPRFLQTVTGKGYRFIATVDAQPKNNGGRVDHSSKIETAPDLNRLPAAPPGKRRALYAATALAVAVLLVSGLAGRFDRKETGQLIAIPFTALPGIATAPSFSPDGKQIVYLWNPNGAQRQIYVQTIGSSAKPLQLTNYDSTSRMAIVTAPVWSPDGQWIAYGRYNPDGQTQKAFELVLVPAPTGGHEIILTRTADDGRGLAWSRDSRYLAYTDYSPGQPASIYSIDRSTLTVTQLTHPPSGTNASVGDSNPLFSADGRHLAFFRSPSPGINQILLLDLESHDSRTVLTEFSSDSTGQTLAWDSTGRGFIYVSDRGGTKRLWHLSLSGGAPEPLPFGEDASTVAVSVESHRLAFTQELDDVNIWRLQVQGDGTSTRSALVTSSRLDYQPELSPDGSKLVFVSDRSGFDEIWVSNSDGTDPMQLTRFNKHKTGTPRWSPDGKHIAFDSRVNGHSEIFVVQIGGAEPQLITNDAFDDTDPFWSPDGNYIYYGSNRSGDGQVWRTTLSADTPVQVTHQGGGLPHITPDGRYMVYLKTVAPAVLGRKELPNGPETILHGSPSLPELLNFVATDAGVYFSAPEGDSDYLRFYSFEDQQVHQLQQLGHAWGDMGLALSQDLHTVLWSQHDQRAANIMLVDGYQ